MGRAYGAKDAYPFTSLGKDLARTWQEQNPDWEYHLWNGEEMDELVARHFPEYLSMYRSFPYNVQRWDTIRYMILYVYGGLYTDLDTECFRPSIRY